MKIQQLKNVFQAILACFGVLGVLLGVGIAFVTLAVRSDNLSSFYALVLYADGLAVCGVSVLASWLFEVRKRLLEEKVFCSEFFTRDHFVYTETLLKQIMAKRAKHHNLSGVLAAINVQDLHGDILALYGPNAVKEINETVLTTIAHHFADTNGYNYAFNMLEGFFVYSSHEDKEAFYKELHTVSLEVAASLKKTQALPSVKLLIGVEEIKKDETPEEILNKALFAEKFKSNSRLLDEVVVYDEDMMAHNEAQRALAVELDRALKKEEFELYFQPKYSLKGKCFYGAESLIRWHHPTRGLLPPSLFIPFAEASGNIMAIDYYVFEHVCRRIAEWKKQGNPLLYISVNLSRKTVYNPGLLDYFRSMIERYQVDPRMIEIELTESIAAKDSIYIADMIKKLREIGFRTSIDDFGVGYSSFSSLKRIPFNTLKIDKTFIDDIEVNERSRAMVKMVIDLGHSLEMEVVAEGVESEKQVRLLQAMKLDNIQGYFYARALSGFDYLRFLEKHPYLNYDAKGKEGRKS